MIDRLELEVEMKDISASAEVEAELISKGGKKQVPYFVDTENSFADYESDEIVKHLQDNYGEAKAVRPKIHISDNACVSCEG